MKFTKEEISLCKQVAERNRKQIEYGDWFEFKGNILLQKDMHEPKMSDRCIPLWTISDCLEFFKKRLWKIEYWHDSFEIDWMEIGIICCVPDPDFVGMTIYKKGKTPLKACLKAVLAVFEEGMK